MISATLHQWVASLGIDRETLERALGKSGVIVVARKPVAASDIFRAITGDKEAAMTRKLNAEAEAKERENRMASGEIVTVEEAAALYGRKIAALVQRLESLPSLVPGITFEQRQILAEQIELCKKMGREQD
jgi:hypothetical protein